MDDDTDILEHIADAKLTLACADAVRDALSNAHHLKLSIAEERTAIARGTRFLLDAGAYLASGRLWIPPKGVI
jgi:hypothetical protein